MLTGGLIGRAHELTDVTARTTEHRLVTIVGPGGVGKTALAREASQRLGESFPMGVRHVDLTRTDDPAAVPGTVSAQLGFDSFDALLSSPNDRPVLLVVDNCEHLLDVTASTVSQVLGACRQTSVLATSRAPLELPGESIVGLAPLRLPEVGDDPHRSAAVELFLRRCHDAGVSVADADLPIVIELCRRLDGLPLALEIAAARSRTMSLPEIARRLDDRVDVLDRPRFRGDPRHRSVTDAIRWSYELLSAEAASTLEHLAVCTGPFTAATARAIVDDGVDADAALDELVAVSLVSADTSGDETRYRLLDTVRRFSLDRLARRGATAGAYDRFVDHVVSRTQELLIGATAQWRPHLISELVACFDDIGEAMRWCVANDPSPRRALRLAAPLWGVVHQAHADDVAVLMRRLFERFPPDGSTGSVIAVAVLATAEYVTGHPDVALRLADDAIASHGAEDVAGVMLRRIQGQSLNALGDRSGAVEALREASEIGWRIGATAMADELVPTRSQVIADAGDPGAALAAIDELLARVDPPLSAIVASWARTTRAWIQLRVDPIAALVAAAAALAEARALDYPIAVAVNLRTKAFAELLLDDVPAAVRSLVELRDDLLRRGAISNARILVDASAAAAHRAGHPAWATLAASARALPISTLASSHFELVPLPPTTEPPIGRHDVFAVVGHVLAELEYTANDSSAVDVARPRGQVARRGDLVEFEYAGRAITVRATKGIVDIVRLLAAGGSEVHCLDLADAAVEQASTGELIDASARREYEDRIRELQADIDEAEHDNDYTRAYRYQVELDQLVEHLAAAIGRGGRRRRAADNAERARSAVTHRIKGSIRQLERLHPALGRHLTHSITTGVYCRYHPETPTTWHLAPD